MAVQPAGPLREVSSLRRLAQTSLFLYSKKEVEAASPLTAWLKSLGTSLPNCHILWSQ